MSRITASRPPGRPKDESKRSAIIEAARQLFEADGYEQVTMEQVAASAGVAKMTVYSHFHDKEAVFAAMMQANSDRIFAALPVLPVLPGQGADPEQQLVQFGCAFLKVLLSDGVVHSMHHHFDMLSRNRPLAKGFYNAGPGRMRTILAAYLGSNATERRLSASEALETASDLMSLWLGDLPLRLGLGLTDPLSSVQIAQHVRRCARLIIDAYSLKNVQDPPQRG